MFGLCCEKGLKRIFCEFEGLKKSNFEFEKLKKNDSTLTLKD